jgi:pyruvate dehydrogenase E1 component alpha subunit
MTKIRAFENILDDYNKGGKLYGTTHLYNGEEAIATGICYLLQNDDLILSTHRNHGHAIAKGTDTYKMFAEIFGRITGTNRGRAGSMHISDHSVGNIGGNGIVGGNYPIGLGLAQAIKMDKKDNIVVVFSGDGATNEGTFHESMNLAAIWHLPIVFVIENNQYAMSTSVSKMISGSIVQKAGSYNMRGFKINGQDIYEVIETFQEVKEDLKYGPVLLEIDTYRFKGHSRSDNEDYRTQDEYLKWQDPIKILREKMFHDYDFTSDELALLEEQIYNDMADQAARAWADEPATLDNMIGGTYAK